MEFALFASLSPIMSIPTTLFLLLLIISHYVLQRRNNKLQPPPFSPPGAWPVIGHLHMLRHANLPHHALGAMADKYGPIFRLQLGSHSTLVVSNREMAREAMWLNDAAAATRPTLSSTRAFTYDYALFGLAPTSPYWREMRKITMSLLLSNQRVDMVKTLMFSQVDMSLEELHHHRPITTTAAKETSGSVSVELKSWFGDVIYNMVLKIIVGKRGVGPNGELGGEEGARELQRAIKDSFLIMGRGLLSDYFPFVGRLGLDGGEANKIKKIVERCDVILQGWLEEHKILRKGDSFINSLLSLLDDNKLPDCFQGDIIIKATTLSMISGGTGIAATLTWAISLLLNNPRTLEKAQQELDTVVGRERRVNEFDISKLVYIQAIVKETMRLYPAAPLLAPREFLKDCMVGGYFVPKGTRLIPNIWKIQTDPQVWPDAFEFKPERFLMTHKNRFELFPFGSGRRSCPGVAFGLQMIHFTLAGFLQSFDLKNPTGDAIDMTESYGMANEKMTPLNVLVTSRLTSNLHDMN